MRIHAQIMGRAKLGLVAILPIGFGPLAAFGDVVSVSVNPTTVYGTDSSAGTVILDLSGVPRPSSVDLTSSNPAVASVPLTATTTLRDPETAHFAVTTYPVATSTNVTITASHSGTSRQAIITVRPPALTSIAFNPNPVRGGDNSVATITINRPSPGTNWLCSIQNTFPPTYFMTGSIVSFPAGAMSTTKTVNTVAVNSPVDALITVQPPTGQSPTVSGFLTVVPTRVESITLAPPSVTGGAGSLGCVTLNGPAAISGASVQLSSSDPDVAGVAPTLQIPFDDDDGCFLVQSHAVNGCASAVISATFGGRTGEATLSVGETEQITDNAHNDRWGSRHSTTSGGKELWTDGDDVYLDDGSGTQLVQARGDLEAVEDAVFGLGSGVNAVEVIGAWRRGTDFAWVWRSGGQPVLVNALNPIDPQEEMNPEAIAIADGSVFLSLQAFFNAASVKHVFRVDPSTGQATNLTGKSAVPGVSRITTSGGKAAWLFVDSANPKLYFYDGSSVTVIDSGDIKATSLRLGRGRLVYEKIVDAVSHVFLYDSALPSPAPVRLSLATDAAHGNFAPATDGYHVAWLHGDADGSDLHILLNGGLQLTADLSQPFSPIGFNEFPLQLQRGQLLWKDKQSNLRYAAAGVIETLCLTPASTFSSPWLADGYVAGFGPILDSTATDNEVFLYPGMIPDDADLPMPPILVLPTPGAGSVILEWDRILGASSFNVYLAEAPGVTKANYGSLAGGRRISGVASPATRVCNLTDNVPYYFVVTTSEGEDEGGISAEVSSTPEASWVAVPSDFPPLLNCLSGPGGISAPAGCSAVAFARADLSCDGDVDLADFAALSNFVGP